MKLCFKNIVMLIALVSISLPVSALDTPPDYLAESEYPLVNAKIFEFHSRKAGRTYRIIVSLPGSYATSGDDKRYPVLYTVDGQWHFSVAQAAIGGLYYDRGARESIVVGITWVGDEDNANRLRVEDFNAYPQWCPTRAAVRQTAISISSSMSLYPTWPGTTARAMTAR